MSDSIVTCASNGQLVTTSLDISQGAALDHASVMRLVRNYHADLEEFGLVGFEIRARLQGQHGGGNVEYAILNEQHATLIFSYMRNTDIVRRFKKTLIKQFFDMRERLNSSQFQAPKTFTDALRLALRQAETIEAQAAALEDAKPKVEFALAVRDVDGVCSIEKFAKTIGWGRNRFFAQLRCDGILLENRMPMQRYIERSYFRVIEQKPWTDSAGASHPSFTTMITGRGQVWLAKRYGKQASQKAA